MGEALAARVVRARGAWPARPACAPRLPGLLGQAGQAAQVGQRLRGPLEPDLRGGRGRGGHGHGAGHGHWRSRTRCRWARWPGTWTGWPRAWPTAADGGRPVTGGVLPPDDLVRRAARRGDRGRRAVHRPGRAGAAGQAELPGPLDDPRRDLRARRAAARRLRPGRSPRRSGWPGRPGRCSPWTGPSPTAGTSGRSCIRLRRRHDPGRHPDQGAGRGTRRLPVRRARRAGLLRAALPAGPDRSPRWQAGPAARPSTSRPGPGSGRRGQAGRADPVSSSAAAARHRR